MVLRRLAAFGALLLFFAGLLSAQENAFQFRFRYDLGERYRIVGTNNQEIIVDGALSGRVEILTRIQSEVVDVSGDEGTIEANYQISEQNDDPRAPFELAREYETRYSRDALGHVEVPGALVMPQVRDVPTFPERELTVGERWSAPAVEVHDLRPAYGIEDTLRIPVEVHYRFLGIRRSEETPVPMFSAYYEFDQQVQQYRGSSLQPVRMRGFADQVIYWDVLRGRPKSYEESYRFLLELSDGRLYEFRGTADGEVVASQRLDRNRLSDEILEALDALEVEDTDVRSDERGVTISVENIQFAPDSARLLDSEKEKLGRIGEILSRYPDRDILVTGHTALAGTEEGRLNLSQERAAAVGEYLLELGVRSRDEMLYRGVGAQEPIAPNDTEAGRRKNRRVEITILEN
jgi:outer membrane protein OmpA-like peptidoglycan-associated protein